MGVTQRTHSIATHETASCPYSDSPLHGRAKEACLVIEYDGATRYKLLHPQTFLLGRMIEDIQFAQNGEPIYRQLAAAIAERIARGDFVVGNKLPPQRDIARMLGINLTTVTRAFATLQQRGLVESRSGRGSVIMSQAANAGFQSAPTEEPGLVDLSVNRPPTQAYLTALAGLLPQLAKDRRYPALQDFHAPEGPAWARGCRHVVVGCCRGW